MVLEKFNHIFLSVIQRLIIFLSAIQRLIIFLSAIQRLIIFVSAIQRFVARAYILLIRQLCIYLVRQLFPTGENPGDMIQYIVLLLC